MITDYAVGFLTIDPYTTMSESVCSNPGGSSAIEADVTGRNRASEQSDLSRRRFVSFRRRKDLNDSAINTRHTARRNLPPLPPLDSESLSFAVAEAPLATVAERPSNRRRHQWRHGRPSATGRHSASTRDGCHTALGDREGRQRSSGG
jgi:hypothetical protein